MIVNRGTSMNHLKFTLTTILGLMIIVSLSSCGKKDNQEDPAAGLQSQQEKQQNNTDPQQLPVRFQNPSYFTQNLEDEDVLGEETKQYEIKVGANISSTRGPQPLWDILKRLANLKQMNVSWSSDVDQTVLVDVNISADDNFFDAIDNLLRQVDYYHDIEKDNTIVVKYKETRQFHITIPYIKGTYTTAIGGNFLTDRDAATGTEGTVKIDSADNEFDVWTNITANLDTLLSAWETTTVSSTPQSVADSSSDEGDSAVATSSATRRYASGGAYYTVDKSVGLITVTAPRALLEKVDFYLESLKTELYRQVIIEAKIIEVYLQENSRIGLDWSNILKEFSLGAAVEFGLNGQIWPWVPAAPGGESPTRFITKASLGNVSFNLLLNALNEQGTANVLANPKVTVLNGQPAIISVGVDIAYIKSISADIDTDTGIITYTTEVDSVVEGIALGVMPSITSHNSVMLHLTPITTDLVDDPIVYEDVGNLGGKVGLPRVAVREVSTMVEVQDGEMLIIGGLIDNVQRDTSDMAPIVGSIPFIKYFFGVEEKISEKRELVILLTPRII